MKIKQLPEDFIVKEVISKKPIGEGEYTWFTLRKVNWDTLRVLDLIAKKCGMSRKSLQYVGLKDKRAITYQTISAWKIPENVLKNIKIRDVELSDFDKNNKPIKTADLKGNWFEIIVRDLKKTEIKNIGRKIKELKNGVINLFDEQRFGVEGKNHLIGKLLVKKDFEGAVRTFLKGNGKWEVDVENHLSKTLGDFEGAINCLPKNLKMLFVNAYQSYLWNTIAKSMKTKHNVKIPLIGFATKLENYPKLRVQIENLLKKEQVKLEDFKDIFEKTSFPGDERCLFVKPKKIKWKIEKDELNKGKNKLIISFELPKGSYGTQVIKDLF